MTIRSNSLPRTFNREALLRHPELSMELDRWWCWCCCWRWWRWCWRCQQRQCWCQSRWNSQAVWHSVWGRGPSFCPTFSQRWTYNIFMRIFFKMMALALGMMMMIIMIFSGTRSPSSFSNVDFQTQVSKYAELSRSLFFGWNMKKMVKILNFLGFCCLQWHDSYHLYHTSSAFVKPVPIFFI